MRLDPCDPIAQLCGVEGVRPDVGAHVEEDGVAAIRGQHLAQHLRDPGFPAVTGPQPSGNVLVRFRGERANPEVRLFTVKERVNSELYREKVLWVLTCKWVARTQSSKSILSFPELNAAKSFSPKMLRVTFSRPLCPSIRRLFPALQSEPRWNCRDLDSSEDDVRKDRVTKTANVPSRPIFADFDLKTMVINSPHFARHFSARLGDRISALSLRLEFVIRNT